VHLMKSVNQPLRATSEYDILNSRLSVSLTIMRKVVLALLIVIIFSPGYGQTFEPCKTVDYIDYLDQKYPGIKQHVDDAYHQSVQATKLQAQSHGKRFPIDTTYVVQVVFHVVWKTADQNIDDLHIQEQVQVLNNCFNRLNADTTNTREIFKSVAGNARFRFELATVDPSGNATNGITRKQTTVTTFNTNNRATRYDYVKESNRGGVDAWDTKRYLNVWVCNLDFTTGQLGLFGYAFPPTGAEFWKNTTSFAVEAKQGVVIHYEIVGPNNPAKLDPQIYTNEKTAVHEFGHFLGLRHLWGDGQFNGCSVDDFIDDTPNAAGATRGCPIGANTCNTDNLPDQVENYMDYGSDICSNMFTKQQVDVMRYNLVNLRAGLGQPEINYLTIPERIEHSIYPNPVSDNLKFFSETIFDQNITLTLTNYLGQDVYEVTKLKTGYILEFDYLDVANGYYRATISYGGKTFPYVNPFVFLKD
jgi:hypothetical protein